MTSRHGSDGGRRGIAPWIVVTTVAVVVVVAATVGYLFIVRADDNESAAANCTSQVTLPIAAAPGAEAAIAAAATSFDATGPVARSACVTTAVSDLADGTTNTSPVEQWKQNPGAAPAMWVADSEAELLAVEATDSGLTAGRDTEPIATSPVVLAVRSADASAAAALSWRDLPMQTGPDGTVQLTADRQVILALPNPSTNRATSYALQSVLAAGVAPAEADKPVDTATVTARSADLAELGAGGPAGQPATTEEALTQLAAGSATFTAVPVVESDLTKFSVSTPGLTAVSPQGGAVGDAIWPVALTAGWVTPTLEDAAARFAAYLRSPAGTAALVDNGLQPADGASSGSNLPATSRSASASPSPSTASTAPISLPDAGAEVANALETAVGAIPAG